MKWVGGPLRRAGTIIFGRTERQSRAVLLEDVCGLAIACRLLARAMRQQCSTASRFAWSAAGSVQLDTHFAHSAAATLDCKLNTDNSSEFSRRLPNVV